MPNVKARALVSALPSGVARTGTGTGTLLHGLPLRELLGLSTLRGVRVLGGAAGLDRLVKRLNVMTLPDILPWVKESELLLTTGYPLPRLPEDLAGLVTGLDGRGLAALGIKLGQYVDWLPPAMLRRADELGFPILEIPHEVAFDDILSQVLTDIANREASTLLRSEQVHRIFMQIVLEGGGLAEITGELAELLGSTVAAIDGDGRVLAESGPGEFADCLATGDAAGADGWLCDGRELIRSTCQAAGNHVAAVPIAAGSLHYGRLVAMSAGHALPGDAALILERAATVAALDITKALAVAAVEHKYQSDFLHGLLMGRADTPGDVDTRARMLGWDLDRPLAVIVAESEPAPERRGLRGADLADERLRSRVTNAWKSAVRAYDPAAAAVGFGTELLAIVGAAESGGKPVDIAKLMTGVAARMSDLTRRTFCYGVSRTADGMEELPEAYKQASYATKVGRQMQGPGAVTHFDSLGVFRLLSLIDDDGELRSFLHDTLGPVLHLGEQERDDLLHTLKVLIDCNMNAAATAQALHFHYNTVRYRIAKLERLLGGFTSDRDICHRISVALQIIQLRDLACP